MKNKNGTPADLFEGFNIRFIPYRDWAEGTKTKFKNFFFIILTIILSIIFLKIFTIFQIIKGIYRYILYII